ncbi:MAG: EAL domain-containing protein [Sphingomonadaceae bacterium]|nr:EAL domain-containing protein [Sphingomonadaceae bacterium]
MVAKHARNGQSAAPQARVGARPREAVRAQELVDDNWRLIAPIMAVITIVTAASTGTVPGIPAGALIAAAMWLAWAMPRVNRREKLRRHDEARRQLLHGLHVSAPMLLFGLAIGCWTEGIASVNWRETIGAPVIASSLAAIILNRRIASIIGAIVATWLGIALVAGNIDTLLILTGGAAIGVHAAVQQARSDRVAAETERERRRSQQRAEQLLNEFEESGQGWFFETDRRGALLYASPTVGKVLGQKPRALVGKPLAVLFQPDAEEGERTLAFHLTARSAFNDLALRAAVPGEERWWSISARPLYDEFGNFLGFRGSGHDLTEKRRSQQHASRLAHYDSLTGLANRLQMAQTLERLLAAPNPGQRACAIFLLDLDRFKQVNDTLGHPAGDALLTQVAERLKHTVGELGRVGRLGGDEFEVVLPGRHKRPDLAALADRVIRNLSLPYQLDGHRVVIGASIGIALSPEDGVTSDALIRNADLALYAAKDAGRGRHHFYAADLHSDAEERRQLEADLREAVASGGLELAYQPVVQTTSERITGFEALLRWTHPVHGPLSPAKFIPIAEDIGLIAQIGEWALRRACAQLAKWPESVRVAVNVSPLQFANPALPAVVTQALANAQVSPDRLELEITESVFLNEDEGVEKMFAALKGIGVRLVLDDFGTGYSSLGYLKRAPFNKIKIDQSFVRGATQPGSRNGAIISSIVSLAEALGMETTAEGVETLDELDLVRQLGCSHVQGYIYDRPLTFHDATARLASGLTAIASGPRSARAARQTMLRTVALEHGGQQYQATLRNVSTTGALVEGLWNVPPGTIFQLHWAEGQILTATARWSQQDRMGVEFATPLASEAIAGRPPGRGPDFAVEHRRAVGE